MLNLKKQINEYCKKNHISGVLRVTLKDKTVYEQYIGFADFEHKIPFDNNSMFSFYSLSKPFCALGLLKLKDKGLINLDAHPSKYVPEAKGFNQNATVFHLLHHTSGLPDFEQIEEFKNRYEPGYAKYTREHLKLLTRYPSYFEPGTSAKYANINFVLCALIIENVTGMDYASYMKKEVFVPLGMKTAVIDNENLTIPNRVQGYELKDEKLIPVKKSHNWLLGAGDIVGTVDDVYCLNKVIKNRTFLSENSWEMVLTPSPINQMGMGCSITNWHTKYRITHNGGHYGFRTLHIQLPEDDFDIIFLSNSGFGDARVDISNMIFNAFYNNNYLSEESIEMDKGYI